MSKVVSGIISLINTGTTTTTDTGTTSSTTSGGGGGGNSGTTSSTGGEGNQNTATSSDTGTTSSTGGGGNTGTTTSTTSSNTTQAPTVTVSETFIDDGNGVIGVGDDLIRYDIAIKNSGNVTLDNILVEGTLTDLNGNALNLDSGPSFSGSDQGSALGTLQPGETARYLAYHLIDETKTYNGGLVFTTKVSNGTTLETSVTVTTTLAETSNTSSDTTPPIITLTGATTITLTQGDDWTDPGATASDNIDGDLTSSITISMSHTPPFIETSNTGTFYISYTVFDSSGNRADVFRTVIINEASLTYEINVTASSASDYTLSGSDRNGNVTGNDPSVTIKVGDTIDFAVDASGHPFI